MAELLLDENELIERLSSHLADAGYQVTSRLSTIQQGIDLTARHPALGLRLYAEAKGGTSSRTGSNRFGLDYSASQVFDRVAKGVSTALELRVSFPGPRDVVVLAVPDAPAFRRRIASVERALDDAGVSVIAIPRAGPVIELAHALPR